MLAIDADIIFFVDKSASAGQEFEWIADIVSRSGGLNDYLSDPLRDINPRYGLIGFGDDEVAEGHSHLLDVSDSNSDGDRLFGTAEQLAAVVGHANFANDGSDERAWDAIEHAIAEYKFREGAAVIFVLFRRDDSGGADASLAGNYPNSGGQHTHAGVVAALESYNASLNVVVEALFDPRVGDFVLGVEADEVDGKTDGRHLAHVNVGPDVLVVSHQGSNSGTYVDSGKSVLIGQGATAQIAGPSLGGYRAQATTYAFEDISSTGTAITNWDNAFFKYKELSSSDLGSFSFPFFGETRTSLIINADGSITFEEPSEDYQDEHAWTETKDPDQPRIAPLWEFFTASPTDAYWQVKNSGQTTERLIVQWDNFQIYNTTFDPTNRVTFQAALYKNGDIVFSYEDIDIVDALYTEGKQATVGIAADQYVGITVLPKRCSSMDCTSSTPALRTKSSSRSTTMRKTTLCAWLGQPGARRGTTT